MAVDPEDIHAISIALVQLYRDVELRLATLIASYIRRGIDAPAWMEERLAAIGDLRRAAGDILGQIETDASELIRQYIAEAYRTGWGAALTDIPEPIAAGLAQAAVAEVPRVAAMESLAAALIADVGERHANVLRHVIDVYRATIAQAAALSIGGGVTRLQASQDAYARLTRQGVAAFVDARGRTWRLSSYVEMAVRTVTQRAAVQGQTDRLQTLGLDLVIVSNSPRECPKCRPWENRILSLNGQTGRLRVESVTTGRPMIVEVGATVDQARRAGLMHPNCFPGEVLVSAPSGVVAADARWYQGPLVVIHTAGGDELPVTPNHPVLTPEGWVPAGSLQVGQSVLRYRGNVERVAEGGPDDEQVPARIGDVFDALRQASAVPTVRVPVAPEQFHGDGFGSDVDVVLADGQLGDGAWQQCSHGEFVRGGVGASSLLASGALLQVLDRAGLSADSVVSGSGECRALLGSHTGRALESGVAAAALHAATQEGATDGGLRLAELAADLILGESFAVQPYGLLNPRGVPLPGNASSPELPVEGGSVDLHGGRDLAARLASLIAADRVVQVEQRGEWSGHVYNLQTRDGWYVASGLVVHNCTHSLRAYLPGATRILEAPPANPEGYEAKERQRAIERHIRAWKERAAAALTPEAKRAAEAKVRAWQAEMRAHLEANSGLKRLRYREQIGAGNIPRP